MRQQLLIKFSIFILLFFISGTETLAGIKEALKFAREGIDRAVEIAPRIKKRKSFDSRSYYPGETKIYYKVSMKRDTSNDVIIKSTGFSEIDELTIETKFSRIGNIESLEKVIIYAWEMLNKRNFIRSDRKTDRVEMKVDNYRVNINVRFEGSDQAEVKVAKIKIVAMSEDEIEKAIFLAIRRYKVSENRFI